MKILIFVNFKHLETLHKFIGGSGKESTIEWYHDRPGLGRFFMVSLDYNDFVKLDDRK